MRRDQRHVWEKVLIGLIAVAVVVSVILAFAILIALSWASTADARKVTWRKAGASVFGGGDGSGCVGYRGANLCGPLGRRAFAELGMGTALGGLPHKARIRVLYRGRKLTLTKRDIGLGGGAVGGWRRAIDLWHVPARTLGVRGLAVVQWRRVR